MSNPRAQHSESNQPEGQCQDRPFVAQQTFARNPPAVEEEERGDKQKQEELGIEVDLEIEDRRNQHPQCNLDERQGYGDGCGPRDEAAGDDCDEENERNQKYRHGGPPQQIVRRRSRFTARFASWSTVSSVGIRARR